MKRAVAVLIVVLLMLPAQGWAATDGNKKGCRAVKNFKPDIKITLDIPPIQYDFNRTTGFLTDDRKVAIAQWQSKQEDAVWSSAGTLEVGGLTRGGVGVETQVQLIAKPYDSHGVYYCPYVKKLEVKFYYSSTIFVASEHQRGTCRYDAIMEHEMKHHNTNVKTVKEVVTKFKKDLPKMIAYIESKYIPREQVEKKFKKMNISVKDAFEVYSDVMVKELAKKNGLIDTPEEYERVSAVCR